MATIAFFPEGAYGPTNNCVGIGDVLRRRGHRVVFIVEESFAGTLEAQGFEERLMRLTPPPLEEEVPGQFWKDFIRDTAPVFRQPTIEQLAGFIAPTFQALVDGAKLRRRAAARDHRRARARRDRRGQRRRLPGAAGLRAAVGADRLLQPDRDQGPRRPAAVLRLSGGRPRRGGTRTGARTATRTPSMHADFDAFCRERGAPPLPDLEFMFDEPVAEPLPLSRRGRLPARDGRSAATWHNLRRACARPTRRTSCPSRLRGDEPARLPQPRLARLGRRRADANAGRRARRRPVPRDRLQGPAARPVRAAPATWPARSSCRRPRSCRRSIS